MADINLSAAKYTSSRNMSNKSFGALRRPVYHVHLKDTMAASAPETLRSGRLLYKSLLWDNPPKLQAAAGGDTDEFEVFRG
ncbi:hypothetical protein MMC14_006522 [Varicellaria rhodocarpa]|nr:hypothetical protein [Varicellaria rhodocarpa]